MTKQEFFEELNQLLENISSEEKEEAIRFYENYFEDAGKENEEAILNELGSPQKVADSIKQSVIMNEAELQEQGYFTEKGYENGFDGTDRQEVFVPDKKNHENSEGQEAYQEENKRAEDNYSENNQYRNNQSGNNRYGSNQNGNDEYRNNQYYGNHKSGASSYHSATKGKTNIFLLILLGIILIPVGIPLIMSILGFIFSVAITVLLIWAAFVITSVVMLITGILVIGFSLFQLFTIPSLGFFLAGIGLIIFGVGILFTLATVWMTRKVLPFLFNSFINIIKLPFRNRRAIA